MDIIEEIGKIRLLPVVALDKAENAIPLAKALIDGGLPAAEITFRTAAARDSICAISEKFPEMIVGAGTVTNLEQAKAAVEAGAKFIVTPGFSDEITAYAVDKKIPIFPGVCTPTEIMQAMKYDLKILKFFPAGQYGGLKTIKALAGPFPALRFMPTGGVNAENLKEYLAEPKVFACGGSWMVKGDLIAAGRFNEIERLTHDAMMLVSEV